MVGKPIFEMSVQGRRSMPSLQCDVPEVAPEELLGTGCLRSDLPLPELSELEVVRHFTHLAHSNYSVDGGFYPLGSCTMKYNPKLHEWAARLPGFAGVHPLQPAETVQGALQVIHEVETWLAEIGGMGAATIQPAAGAHAELVSLMMVHDYLRDCGQPDRNVVLIPESAHGTNPASAARCGFKVRSIPAGRDGLTDVEALDRAADSSTAALMLTNPNTLGLFERDIVRICDIVHRAGGLVYCDGANMNAIAGVARPGDMGFDVMHFNLHKTFSTPHGGGGPGCGAVAVKAILEPYLPTPVIVRNPDGTYTADAARPKSIGPVHSFYGAFLVAVRAYAYLRELGPDGVRAMAQHAVLNANYARTLLRGHFDIAHDRTCMHEVVISASRQKQQSGVKAMDISKRLIDYGYHPPTNYFPLIVPEALMIEPTETETPETIEAFCATMATIAAEIESDPELVKSAPHTTRIARPDETAAVKSLDVRWQPGQ